MASIKISKLADLSKDLLTNDDVFIVNDANLTTMSIKYGTIVEKIQETDHLFTGDVEFSGSVTVSGILANRNFYTKTEVDTIVADGDAAVMVDVNKNTLDVESLRSLSGAQRTVQGIIPSVYIGGTFVCSVIPEFSAGALNIVQAVNAVGKHIEFTVTPELASLASGVADNTVAITTNLDKNVEQDDRLDTLEAAVGLPGGNDINDNSNLISGNKDLIDNLHSVLSITEGDSNLGVFPSAHYLVDNSNVKNNLLALDTRAFVEAGRLDATISNLQNTDTAVVANTGYVQKLTSIIDTAAQGVTPTDTIQTFAATLAAAIAAAIANGTLLP